VKRRCEVESEVLAQVKSIRESLGATWRGVVKAQVVDWCKREAQTDEKLLWLSLHGSIEQACGRARKLLDEMIEEAGYDPGEDDLPLQMVKAALGEHARKLDAGELVLRPDGIGANTCSLEVQGLKA